MANASSSTSAGATTPLDPVITSTSSAPPPTTTVVSRPYLSSNSNPPLLPLPTPSYTSHPLLGSILGRPPSNPPHPSPSQGGLYPVGGVGLPQARGCPPKTRADQMVTVANAGGFNRSGGAGSVLGYSSASHSPRPLAFTHADQVSHLQQQQPVISARPQLQTNVSSQFSVPRQVVCGTAVGNGTSSGMKSASGVPHHKVNLFPARIPVTDYNNYKDLREKSRDDSVVMVHDRKVRLQDGVSGSLYALCRSWVRNGSPQENQSTLGDGVRLLPRPQSLSVVETAKLTKCQGEEDENAEEDEHISSVENLSTHDLLDGHIKKAKRIRAELRVGRKHRIDRYKQRLSLLLPLPVEQDRNNAIAGS